MHTLPVCATVATVIEPSERPRLDAAANGRFRAVHADTVTEVIRTVRERPVHAILVSPGCIERDELQAVTTLIKGFPGVPTVAVTTQYDAASNGRLLELGARGVRTYLDLSVREGWQGLRELVAHPAASTGAVILGRLVPALGSDTSRECQSFFEMLVRMAPGVKNVRQLSRRVGVEPSTIMSRFFRARLPSPKSYLAAIRLVYAAGLLDAPGLSIADVAYRLDYSSPQSFGRHLRSVLGLTAGEFRRRYPFDVALQDFLSRLIIPFRPSFRSFHPLARGG